MAFLDVEQQSLSFTIKPRMKYKVDIYSDDNSTIVKQFDNFYADDKGFAKLSLSPLESGKDYSIFIYIEDFVFTSMFHYPEVYLDDKGNVQNTNAHNDFPQPKNYTIDIWGAVLDMKGKCIRIDVSGDKELSVLIISKDYPAEPSIIKKFGECVPNDPLGGIIIDIKDLPKGYPYLIYILDDDNDIYYMGRFRYKDRMNSDGSIDYNWRDINLKSYHKEKKILELLNTQ